MPTEEISFIFRHPSRAIRRRPLRDFWSDLAQRVGAGHTCLITRDHELRELNRRFRRKDYATDVLSFPPDEIAISLDRAAAQAAEFGHSVDEELKILMLHGVLHLAGMDHETDSGEMARAEARWRRKFGLPCGLVERATKRQRGVKSPLQAEACSATSRKQAPQRKAAAALFVRSKEATASCGAE